MPAAAATPARMNKESTTRIGRGKNSAFLSHPQEVARTVMLTSTYRFKEAECRYCKEKGHLARACRAKAKGAVSTNLCGCWNKWGQWDIRHCLWIVYNTRPAVWSDHHLYLPNLSSHHTPLCTACWESIRNGFRTLVHFDPNKLLILTCDASQYGIRALLSHIMEDMQIAYKSTEHSMLLRNVILSLIKKHSHSFRHEEVP